MILINFRTFYLILFIDDMDITPEELAKPLNLVSRDQWLALPPKASLTPLELPATRVIISHTVI